MSAQHDPTKFTVAGFDSGPEHTALAVVQVDRTTGAPSLLSGVRVESTRRALVHAMDRLGSEQDCGLHLLDMVAIEEPRGFNASRFNPTPVIDTAHVAGGLDWHFQSYGFTPVLLTVTAWRMDMMNGLSLVNDAMVAVAVADLMPPPETATCTLCDGKKTIARMGRAYGRTKTCPGCRGAGVVVRGQPRTDEHVRDAFGLACVAAWRELGVRQDYTRDTWVKLEEMSRAMRTKATTKAQATRSRNATAKAREAAELRPSAPPAPEQLHFAGRAP